MREKDPKPTQLRQQAEAFLQENPLFAHHRGSENLHEILHELRTAYAELEIQNEELRRAQHDLILSRDKYYELYDFAPIGYCSLDLASTVVEANLALADLLGKPRLHLLKRPLAHFIALDSHEVLRDMLRNALREGVEQSCQIEVLNDPLKGPRYLRLQCSLTKDGQRIPTGFRLAIIDVSAMVQQERELELLTLTLDSRVQERTGEVERQSERLRALANDLLKEEQRQRHALATELHDYLAQLLVVASMKTHLLAPLVDQAEARRYVRDLEKILRDAQEYARTLIADLSPAVLFEQGLAAAMRHLVENMHEQGLEVGLRMKTTAEPSREAAIILYQSVRELLHNAMKYAKVQRASVQVAERSGMLEITVSDEGCGFDPEELPKVVVSHKKFGLLSIQQRLQAIGGRLDISTAVNQGTVMTLLAPLAQAGEAAGSVPGAPEEIVRDPLDEITVLVADDHNLVRKNLKRYLDEQPGFRVIGEAKDGVDAIEQVRKLHPAAVLMDINMPRMNGIEATRVITQEFSPIAVVGLSIRDDAHAAEQMRAAGAVDLFVKGAPLDPLIQCLRTTCAVGGQ